MYAQIQPQQYPTDGIKTNMSSQFKKKKSHRTEMEGI